MKKAIIIFVIVLWLAITWFFWYNYYLKNINNQKNIKEELENITIESNSWSEELTEQNSWFSKDKDEKIEILRKRFSLRWTIARWDSYSEANQPIYALNEYLKALKQSPNDEQIIKKLAWVYFDLKRFKSAVETYEKTIPTLTQEEKQKYILWLLYSMDFSSGSDTKTTSQKIRNLWLSEQETFHYINAINCTIDFHSCKKNYDIYFSKVTDISFDDLLSVKTALTNFKNFQSENLYYKDALIIWALFKDKLYSVSNFLAKKMLEEKTDYKPMLQIIWKWYYELGNLENAKTYLEKYYVLEPKDVNIAFMLWTISFKLKDYQTSNLYYNWALKNWFEPKIELQRKLAYNYYLAWDKRSMLNMFGFLLDDSDATIDDFSLWIYHAILEWRTLNAINRSEKWIKKFEWKNWYEIFYWYLWWIKREENQIDLANQYLKAWYKINPKNPLITLNLWYLEFSEKKYNLALMYFKRTENINWDGEFWELAKKEISSIEKLQKQLENKKQ